MTTNQLAYLQYQQSVRTNDLRELADLETKRSNKAKEAETYRSNLAYETETHRSNMARETENLRHNKAVERETKRNNIVNNVLSGVDVGTKSYQRLADVKSQQLGDAADMALLGLI